MSKELEILEDLSKQEIIVKKAIGIYMDGSSQTMLHKTTVGVEFKGYIEILKQALTEIKAIDNAKLNEALECLKHIIKGFNETTTGMYGLGEVVVGNELEQYYSKELDTIKQALLKAQEQEKVLEIIKEKVIPLVSIEEDGVWDNELYRSIKITKEEYDLLKRWL